MRRRRLPAFVRTALAIVAASAVVLLGYLSFWAEPRSLTLTSIRVEATNWPVDRPSSRIILVSDIHVDRMHMPPTRVRALVTTLNGLSPDLIILAGDYVGGLGLNSGPPRAARARRSPADNAVQESGLRALSALRARDGVFAVLGNHDCWWDCSRVRGLLSQGGVTVLENASAQARGIWIIGLEDGQTQSPDFKLASRDVPEGVPAILVAHNPGLFDWTENRFPLMLAGHTEDTHDGPLVRDGRVLIVSRGLGETGLPVRLLAPPEIVLLEMRRGPVNPAFRIQ